MGVSGLWQIVAPAVRYTTLMELSVLEGFHLNRNGLRAVVIGIDISVWFSQCQRVVAVTHPQAGTHPELRIIFYRLVRFLQAAVIPVFVFDGADRPSTKRGMKVQKQPHWLAAPTQELIKAFGFYWYTAPAEAEAELAYLNAKGFIDAVLTDDSDAFLFGATHVIRNPDVKRDGDILSVYTDTAIKATSNCSLTRGGFLLIAVLSGGDYDQAGLPGCGPKIALRLTQTGLGDRLLTAVLSLSPEELVLFLDNWRQELRSELAHDPNGYLGKRYPKLSKSVLNSFPDPAVLISYASPITSWSDGGSGPPDFDLQIREPHIGALAGICERLFHWSSNLLKKFNIRFWSGVCLRMLCVAEPTYYRDRLAPFNPDAVLGVIRTCEASSEMHTVELYNLRLSIASLIPNMMSSISNTFEVPESDTLVYVWVPAAVMEYALPGLIKPRLQGSTKKESATSSYTPFLLPHSFDNHQNYATSSRNIIELTSDSDTSSWRGHLDSAVIDLTSD